MTTSLSNRELTAFKKGLDKRPIIFDIKIWIGRNIMILWRVSTGDENVKEETKMLQLRRLDARNGFGNNFGDL